jgi:hypothetical protein
MAAAAASPKRAIASISDFRKLAPQVGEQVAPSGGRARRPEQRRPLCQRLAEFLDEVDLAL